jgi:PadR family transcriptional regulator, regulatory protein AphA
MDVNTGLSPTSYVVLGLLESLGPSTPYDLKRAVASSLGNLWTFPHSQFYAEPRRLESAGLIEQSQETGGRRRRTYSLTPQGRSALMGWLKDPEITGHELRDPGLLKLFFGDLVGVENMHALAHAQEEQHMKRALEYERAKTDMTGDDLPFRDASMRMGLVFERAAVRFWRAIADELANDERR